MTRIHKFGHLFLNLLFASFCICLHNVAHTKLSLNNALDLVDLEDLEYHYLSHLISFYFFSLFSFTHLSQLLGKSSFAPTLQRLAPS